MDADEESIVNQISNQVNNAHRFEKQIEDFASDYKCHQPVYCLDILTVQQQLEKDARD